MKKLHVAPSPITNRIYCGHVLKDQMTWAANKTDVTGEACAAVAKHVLANGHPTVITANGVPAFEITVRELRPNIGVRDDGLPCAFTSKGGYASGGGQSAHDPIREVKEKQVRYINIYPNNEISHNSRQTADDCAIHGRLSRIRVEYEEGQFDD